MMEQRWSDEGQTWGVGGGGSDKRDWNSRG